MSKRKNRIPVAGIENAREIDKSLIEHLRDILNVNKVKTAIRIGADIFESIEPLLEKPSYFNAARAVFGVGKVIVEDVETWSDDYFMGDEWSLPFSSDFNFTILKAISGFDYRTVKTSDESNVIRIHKVNGVKMGYVLNTRLNQVDNIYVETEKLERARETIKQLLWQQFKGKNIVMRANKRLVISGNESKVLFEPDDVVAPLTSRTASEYANYLREPLGAGVSRSVLLYGPPGTGKSTMARSIVDTLGLRVFRIRVEDISSLESSTLFEAVNIFDPDAIILDDFDRAHAQAQLLETLEFFERHVKLVIATVNNRNDLDEAVMRPGRFDEHILVSQMDPEVVKAVLGEFTDAFETVKDWPIAFIQEYVTRRRFMSHERASKSIEELARRVKRLDKYSDIDDITVMSKVLKIDDTDEEVADDGEGPL